MRHSKILPTIAILTLIGVGPAAMPQERPPSALVEAETLLRQGSAADARREFEALLQEQPESARVWLGLGKALHELGREDEALEALARADELGAPEPSIAFHAARVHAARKKLDQVETQLSRLADTGVKPWSQLLATPELAALIDAPELQKAMARLRPCDSDAHHQFDFWLGDWEVHPAAGGPAGSNSIESIQDGCAIRETYRNRSYSGTSTNYYDPERNVWNQVWVDNTGMILRLQGGWTGEEMVLESETNRITWTPRPDGTVRQVWEQSRDGGESWGVIFDGTYEPISGGTSQ